jgi:hypothetical protein
MARTPCIAVKLKLGFSVHTIDPQFYSQAWVPLQCSAWLAHPGQLQAVQKGRSLAKV